MEKSASTAAVIRDVETQAQSLLEQARNLEQQLRLARGTSDVAERAKMVAAVSAPYHVGDEGPTPELLEAVKRMLTEHPMTFQEILDMTGARANRVKGVIMRMQREGVRVVNLGTDTKAIWFIPSAEVFERLLRVEKRRRR